MARDRCALCNQRKLTLRESAATSPSPALNGLQFVLAVSAVALLVALLWVALLLVLKFGLNTLMEMSA